MGRAVPHPVSPIACRAPAKVNLCLEVLGRRDDGYHELRTVFQAVGLYDYVRVGESETVDLSVARGAPADERNLAYRAAELLRSGCTHRGAYIELRKRIPAGAGLGGGSSDAAAALSCLVDLWGLELTAEELVAAAAAIGADVPFFLGPPTALGTGRGDVLTPLPSPPTTWMVLAVPPLRLPRKTAAVFAALRPEEYTDGGASEALGRALQEGRPLGSELLYNGLTAAALRALTGLEEYSAALSRVWPHWTVSGAGPAHFTICSSRDEAVELRRALHRLPGRAYAVPTLQPGWTRRPQLLPGLG